MSVPRGLRACLVCAFVQASAKFHKGGCPNCEEFLEMRNSSDTVSDCTSEVFEGLVTVNDTNTGWVSKWLRIQGYVPGVYAVKINGLVSWDGFSFSFFPKC
jgi:transcription elongation factor SPT4